MIFTAPFDKLLHVYVVKLCQILRILYMVQVFLTHSDLAGIIQWLFLLLSSLKSETQIQKSLNYHFAFATQIWEPITIRTIV